MKYCVLYILAFPPYVLLSNFNITNVNFQCSFQCLPGDLLCVHLCESTIALHFPFASLTEYAKSLN